MLSGSDGAGLFREGNGEEERCEFATRCTRFALRTSWMRPIGQCLCGTP